MSVTATALNNPKGMVWTGRVISAIPTLLLIMSAVFKLTQAEAVVQGFGKMGWPVGVLVPLGIVELASAVLYIIPQTAVLGAVLMTGYLGGAIATHVRVEENFLGPLLFGVLVWLGLFLRDARLRDLLPLRRL